MKQPELFPTAPEDSSTKPRRRGRPGAFRRKETPRTPRDTSWEVPPDFEVRPYTVGEPHPSAKEST